MRRWGLPAAPCADRRRLSSCAQPAICNMASPEAADRFGQVASGAQLITYHVSRLTIFCHFSLVIHQLSLITIITGALAAPAQDGLQLGCGQARICLVPNPCGGERQPWGTHPSADSGLEQLCHRSVITDHWSPISDHRSLVTGHWSLVTGHWSLVTGHWSLATHLTSHVSRLTSRF